VPKERLPGVLYGPLAILVLLASFSAAPGLEGAFGGGLGLLMLAIAVKDARNFLIPDPLTLAAFLLGLAKVAVEDFASLPENLALAGLRSIVVTFSFYLLRELYRLVRHRQGLGLGDVKLAAVAGIWLDWPLIPAAIEVAALTALIFYGMGRLAISRPFEGAAKLPFGLYFAPAIWLCWLYGTIAWRG